MSCKKECPHSFPHTPVHWTLEKNESGNLYCVFCKQEFIPKPTDGEKCRCECHQWKYSPMPDGFACSCPCHKPTGCYCLKGNDDVAAQSEEWCPRHGRKPELANDNTSLQIAQINRNLQKIYGWHEEDVEFRKQLLDFLNHRVIACLKDSQYKTALHAWQQLYNRYLP